MTFLVFFLNFRVELNLSLIETRHKAHNKPIINLLGLVHAGELNVEEIYELTIARLPTEPYDRTILSLLVSTVFSSVGENINTTLFIIIFIVLV